MNDPQEWKYDLEEYIRQGEPAQAEKSAAWKTAIGLQAVDGLKTSPYLLETAKEHIEGKISIAAAQSRICSYYEERGARTAAETETKEADIVSARIAMLLGESAFQFSPAEWIAVHRRLFEGVFDHAGQLRDYNITKREWVLRGETVLYASCGSLRDVMEYDFAQEKAFSYEGLSVPEAIRHIAKFTAGIWQIHPFCEGNTRATAVFIIRYLKTFGFRVGNDVFADNSWYFRNALVRANYNDLANGIHATTEYLEMFFENLLLGAEHELKNRFLHVDNCREERTFEVSKVQNDTLKCTLEEYALLKILRDEPTITQAELSVRLGKSTSTVKRKMEALQEKGVLRRVNGKRDGWWEVRKDLPE